MTPHKPQAYTCTLVGVEPCEERTQGYYWDPVTQMQQWGPIVEMTGRQVRRLVTVYEETDVAYLVQRNGAEHMERLPKTQWSREP